MKECFQGKVGIVEVDSHFYRCQIDQINPKNDQASVFFIDIGEFKTVMKDELFELSEEDRKTSAFCSRFRMRNVIPCGKSNNEWSCVAIEFFQKILISAHNKLYLRFLGGVSYILKLTL